MVDLARDTDIAPNKAKSWPSILQDPGVDFLLHPLEIKKTEFPMKRDVCSLGMIDKLGQTIGPGGIICLCGTNLPLTDRFHSIPVAAL